MQDIMDKLQHILSSREGQEQLKNIASMLSTEGNPISGGMNPNPSPPANANANGGSFNDNLNTGFTSTDANSSNAGSQANNSQGSAQPSGGAGGFDMSAIASMLSGLQGGGGSSLTDTLSSLVNNGSNNSQSASTSSESGFPNIDMGMIMGIQKAFSAMKTNDKNTQLLTALKPHFSPERSKKVDQALGLMRLMTALPTLKDSGILSGIL